MRPARLRLSASLLVGLVACGGRAIEEPGSGEPGSGEPELGEPAATAPAQGSAGKSGGTPGSLPSRPLGQCSPGFDRARNPTLQCHWLTESGACFEESDAACACICPSDRDSVCWHGFDRGPNSATLVYCD